MNTYRVGILLCLALVGFVHRGNAWEPAATRCPYLDGKLRPFFAAGVGIIPDARTGDRGPYYTQMEIHAGADLVYFHDLAHGDLDMGLRFDSVLPLRKSAFHLPTHLMALVLETRWFWRYVNNTAFELQLAPGFYASTEDVLDMPLALPVTAAGIYTVDSTLALVAGLQVRPSFHYVFVPYGGVVWQPQPHIRLEATVPDARLTVHLDQEWSGYAGWSWNSTTYHVKPDDGARNRLTFTSQEIYVGVSRALSEELRVSGSLGWATERDIRATRSRARNRETLTIDNTLVLRVGVQGAF